MRTSIRSFSIGLIGLGATAVVRTLVVLGVGGKMGATAISDIGETGVVLAAAAVILMSAGRLPRDDFRVPWLLVGWGTLCFGLGDLVWTVMELGNLGAPYPGPPDFFYLLNYGFIGAAVLIPAVRMRHREEVAEAALVAGLSGIVGVACLYFGLFGKVLGSQLSQPGLVLGVVYPLLDVLLLVMPAIFVLMIALRSGDRGQSLPWLYVSTGLIIMAGTDTAFSWLTAAQAYTAGSMVDYGWMIANVALAVGASLALDAAIAPRRLAVEVVSLPAAASPAMYSMSAREADER